MEQPPVHLRTAEQGYRELFENVPVGLYRSTPQGAFLDANATMLRILGYESLDRLLVTNATDAYVDPQDRARWQETIERTGVVRAFEFRLRRPDGTVIWVRDSASRVRNETGRTIRYDGCVEDVTDGMPDDTETLAGAGQQAGDDLRRSLRRLREMNEERRLLLARLVVAQEEERRRIAGDIHDDPIQVMAAAAVRLDMVEGIVPELRDREALGRAAQTVRHAIDRLRHLVFELRPPALDREGLAAAVRDYLDRMADDSDVTVALRDEISREPSRGTRAAAFRIVQEALTNVRKHAGASRVEVLLERRDGGVVARVTDDGVGFHLERELNRARPGHLGLRSMSERAEALDGWCRIHSRPGEGSTVELWLPDSEADGPFARMAIGPEPDAAVLDDPGST